MVPVENHISPHAGEQVVKIICGRVLDDRRKSIAPGVQWVMEKGQMVAPKSFSDIVRP